MLLKVGAQHLIANPNSFVQLDKAATSVIAVNRAFTPPCELVKLSKIGHDVARVFFGTTSKFPSLSNVLC